MRHHVLLLSVLLALCPLLGQEEETVEFDPVTGAPVVPDEIITTEPGPEAPDSRQPTPEVHGFDPVTGAPLGQPDPAVMISANWSDLSNAQIIRLGKDHARRDHEWLPWVIGGGFVSSTGLAVGGLVGAILIENPGAFLVGAGLVSFGATKAFVKVRRQLPAPLELSEAPDQEKELYLQQYKKTSRILRMTGSFLGAPVIAGAGFIAIVILFVLGF